MITDSLVLTLADVQRRALRDNPAFRAIAQERAIALGGLRQARLSRFNPDLGVTAPGAAPANGASPLELTLTQEVEWAGQRGLRSTAARQGADRATWLVRDAARRALFEASASFVRARAATERFLVAQRVLGLGETLVRAVRTQLSEGEISTLEANLAEIEAGRARARVLSARREASSAHIELARLLGISPDTPFRLVGDSVSPYPRSLSVDSLATLAMQRRPDVSAAAARAQETGSLGLLARRAAIPNLRLGVVAERSRGTGDPRAGVLVGFTLPLLNRNQGEIDQRDAERRRADYEQLAIALRVRADVADAARAWESASEEFDVLSRAVLEPARRNSLLLEEAYRAGKLTLPTLLLLRNQLLDAELGYWNAWLAQQEALLRLRAGTGDLLGEDALLTQLSSTSHDANR